MLIDEILQGKLTEYYVNI